MQRQCDSCGETYQAQRPTSKYCSPRCRTRQSRGTVVPFAERPEAPEQPAGSVTSATRTELEAVERAGTALGQAALALAERIDSRIDTGSALASLTREWRATLEAATANTSKAVSPLDRARDELAKRRERRGA